MKISQIIKNGDEANEWLIMVDINEARLLVDSITEHSEANKRNKKLKKLAKDLADNITCY